MSDVNLYKEAAELYKSLIKDYKEVVALQKSHIVQLEKLLEQVVKPTITTSDPGLVNGTALLPIFSDNNE